MGRKLTANGPEIKRLRDEKDWTQKQLGKQAGYSERTIGSAEAGEEMNEEILDCIAKALGVSLSDITLPANNRNAPAAIGTPEHYLRAIIGRWRLSATSTRGLAETVRKSLRTGLSGKLSFAAATKDFRDGRGATLMAMNTGTLNCAVQSTVADSSW